MISYHDPGVCPATQTPGTVTEHNGVTVTAVTLLSVFNVHSISPRRVYSLWRSGTDGLDFYPLPEHVLLIHTISTEWTNNIKEELCVP